MKNNTLINKLSPHLFWDVDISTIVEEKHLKYIISKVLLYGFYSDWQVLIDYFGLAKIVKAAINIKGLDDKTLSFLSVLSGIPKSGFKCYSSKQSLPKHWNF